ncbi:MAG: SAM-dependent methyltransferase, partial [Myxococcota bacterium]
YDIVFTGVGALVWLPDIRRWATIVAELLNPGGVLVLREMHPMLYTIDDSRKDGVLAVRYPYFETEVPFDEESDGTYADPEAKFEPAKSYCWNHGVGEIVQALLDAGLILERLEETKRCDWEPLPHHSMTKGDQSMWSLEGREELVPMMLAIRARKPA